MEEIQSTGRLAGEVRSTKKVTVTPEKNIVIPAQTIVERTFYGPCLVCAKDMQYSFYWRWNMDSGYEDWLLKQFEPSRRKAHLSFLEGRRKEGYMQLRVLHGIVCTSCQEAFASTRAIAQKKRDEKEVKKKRREQRTAEDRERAREQWDYHTTWRDVTKADLANAPDGAARFTVTIPRRRHTYKILFRWRPVGGQCRGDAPRNVVGMWVDRRFVTHYCAWNLTPYGGESPWDEWSYYQEVNEVDEADVFGVGFCRWFEREFQRELLQTNPAAIWRAKGGQRPTNVGVLTELEYPCVVHTHWIDDSVYARVLVSDELPKVLAFAEKHLRLKVVCTTGGI